LKQKDSVGAGTRIGARPPESPPLKDLATNPAAQARLLAKLKAAHTRRGRRR
jgi:hypothetical protein